MPRPRKPGVEPKRRSRNGCWPCKERKVKCGEEKPCCMNCQRKGDVCDYSIRLNWGDRVKTDRSTTVGLDTSSTPSGSPYQARFLFQDDLSPLNPPTPWSLSRPPHPGFRSNISPRSNNFMIDPELLHESQPSFPPGPAATSSYGYNRGVREERSSVPSVPSASQNSFDLSLHTSDQELIKYNNANCTSVHPTTSTPPIQEYTDAQQNHQCQVFATTSPVTTISDIQSPYTGPLDSYSPNAGVPLTPGSSVNSEENSSRRTNGQQSQTNVPPDLHRMSVQNIINKDFSEHTHMSVHGRRYPIADYSATTYGYDLGLPDLDTPNNDDFSAIAIFSPQNNRLELDETLYGSPDSCSQEMAFDSGSYYAKPVPIRIPKSLGTLPALLMENPMNLLYFHHFSNHTARILVPHDCERNPFRQILPKMAVADENIMNLLLAYSAAHRARMLKHPEPSNRIALWVQDVFPKLRQNLIENPNDISNNTLAAVIMMASLEIICSGTFEVPISWQDHLTMARQMISARGGPCGMGRQDHVAYFLSRWFAYLDVMGSLSGGKTDMSLGSLYWSNQNALNEDFEIDCLLGFTTRCVGSLARVSELAKRCEPQRIDKESNVRHDWRPDPDTVRRAEQIRQELEDGLLERNLRKGCDHRSSASTPLEGARDSTELYATNKMFHWAGLIHLYRRVLGKPASDVEVQTAVREIVGLLYKIRRGSTAEACIIFPMFAAGGNIEDQGQRDRIMERLRSMEGFGMTQSPKVATLLQSVWDTGKPWESLVRGEFFG